MRLLLIAIVKLYQCTVSKLLPPCCRFYPSCSRYAVTALERFGAVKGGYLTIRRIARCNPFSAGGSDPVPERFTLRPGRAGRETNES
ncbi:MAG: membrane protein insertion efficiency factor YidD [Bacteroides sp.]|nr:membrane protein insertion efficiency factor YidD [Eubacterium sp.]MCM1418495.1 membrane protein insertion efficiency factor YidD [Roseburia sp.]MCM1462514.1 membrane protein insertion efficiency factor YidD [Bacteroides sp.]